MPFSSVFKKRKKDTQPSLVGAAEPVESVVTYAGPAGKIEQSTPSLDKDVSSTVTKESPKERTGLFELTAWDPKNAAQITLDIVAVHGLMGDPFRTWTAGDKLWLRDFLPEQLPSARIFSYGYDSRVALSQSIAGVDDYARTLLDYLELVRMDTAAKGRPILFIAHSLGGIVVKKALVVAHECSPIYSNILYNVRGIAFLGVPHRGASIARLGSFFIDLLRPSGFGMTMNADLVKTLERNSDALSNISLQAVQRLKGLQIYTFYETRKMHLSVVVDKDSAFLNIDNERVFAVDADHRDICTFDSASSQKYMLVGGYIAVLAKELCGKTSTQVSQLTNDEKDCIKLFYSPDVNATRLSIPPRVKGTFTWFTEHSTFKQWLMPEGPAFLFLSSNPGCGKTVLCSYLVKRVKLLNPCHTVCYFFCSDSVASQRSATHVLRGFLHQLLVSHNFLVKYVLPHLETKGPAMLDELDTMMTIFGDCSMDPHLSGLVFILDALDECEGEGRALLIKWLKRHFAYLPGKSRNIKFLLTSRPEISITDILDDTAVSRISLEDAATAKNLKRDIYLVIRSRIESMPSLRTLPVHKKRKLRAKLSRNADRTFLWISLVLHSLEESFSSNYEQALAELPTTLEGMYVKILSSIPHKHRAHTKAILEILVASRRPMSLEELNVCWSLTAADTSLDDVTAKLCTDMARVVSQLCGQFVRISENRCHLVHQTAREFLLSGSVSQSILGRVIYWYRITANEAAQGMATKCIRILTFRDKEDHNSYSNARCNAFSQYAFRWWAFHFRELEQHNRGDLSTKAALSALVVNLYKNITSVRIHWYQKMLQLAGAVVDRGETLPRVPPAIVCAYNGHISVMPLLLESPTAVNYHRSLLDLSLLHMAVLGNQEAMVSWLLNHQANTEATDVFKRTPLHLAARRNNPTILQLLLSCGANRYARDSSNKTPLHGAKELCIQENIRLLKEGESNESPDQLAMELDYMASEVDMKSIIPAAEVDARPLPHAIQIRSMLASMSSDFPALSQLQVEEESIDSHTRTLTDSQSRSEGSIHSNVSSDERNVLSTQNMFQTAPISSADFISDSGSSIGSAMSLHSRQGSMTDVISDERNVLSTQNMFQTAPISSTDFISDSGSSIGSAMSLHSRQGSMTGVVSLPSPEPMARNENPKISSNNQKHKCKVCGKRFRRPSSLLAHMYCHTGDKPFACEIQGCGRNFSVVSNLRRPRQVHKADRLSDHG